MSSVILNLLAPIIGATFAGPMWIIVVMLLLRGQRGVIKASGFAAGAMSARLLQGMVFGRLFGPAENAVGEGAPRLVASTLLVVVGVFLLVTAILAWRLGSDTDAPPSKWMAAIGRMPAVGAFGAGLVLMAISMKQWIFTFSAIATIERAELSRKGNIFTYLFFVVGAQLLMMAPIVGSAVAPGRSAKWLAVARGWLERHNLKLAMVVSLIYGTWFVWRGASDLLAFGQHAGLR